MTIQKASGMMRHLPPAKSPSRAGLRQIKKDRESKWSRIVRLQIETLRGIDRSLVNRFIGKIQIILSPLMLTVRAILSRTTNGLSIAFGHALNHRRPDSQRTRARYRLSLLEFSGTSTANVKSNDASSFIGSVLKRVRIALTGP